MNRKSTFNYTSIKSILNSLSDLFVSKYALHTLSNWFWWCTIETFLPRDEDKFSTLTKITSNRSLKRERHLYVKMKEGTGRDLTGNSAFFTPTLLWTFYHVSSSIWNRLKIPKFSRVFRIYVDNWIIGKILSTHHSLSKLYNHMMARISVTWKWAKHASQMGVKWGAIFCQQ